MRHHLTFLLSSQEGNLAGHAVGTEGYLAAEKIAVDRLSPFVISQREMLLCLEKVRWFWDIPRGLEWFPWEGSGIADPIVWGNAYCQSR